MSTVPVTFIPKTDAEMRLALDDPYWRVCSGQLYWIMVKTDDGEGTRVRFKPNLAQRQLMRSLWGRNLILKARQLGFTTLIAILWLDHALFNKDQRCGIVAQDREAAEAIFRDKVKFAYDNLPEALKLTMPLAKDSATELLFAHNNSAIRVATSMRSGTIHRLHVSEFGKIGAKFPDKAQEVVTGSIPAVPMNGGIVVIESTAEGQDGEFYRMCKTALALAEIGAPLTQRQYRMHFFAWWKNPEYRMEYSGNVIISAADNQYLDLVQATQGTFLDMAQRAWYVATRDGDFSGDADKMRQEYPSTPEEAFQVSTEGTYYAVQLAKARADGRIGSLPFVTGVPVDTYWDLGANDGMGIWLAQRIGPWQHFLRYLEGWNEGYSYYVKMLLDTGWVFGTHHLPHDADQKRPGKENTDTPKEMLEQLMPGHRFVIVPRIAELQHGIQMVRSRFSSYRFDEVGCKEGLIHVSMYRKEWNARLGAWKDSHRKDEHTEAADALRQEAQGHNDPTVRAGDRPKRRGARAGSRTV